MSASACSRPAQRDVVAGASRWPFERVRFALAGNMTLLSVALVLRRLLSLRSVLYPRQEASS